MIKILEVIEAVKARLHANRNLCDDFFRLHALRIEEILTCADIELEANADVETVEAAIFLAISNFLSPKVYFYTLDEMRNKCRNAPQYPIAKITQNRRRFTISQPLLEDLNPNDTITVEAGPASGEYTLKCITPNEDQSDYTDLDVVEDIPSDLLEADAFLFKGVVEADRCLTVDQIFEGPKLIHGFIDDEELIKADRMKVIRVSDLIRIIMDVEGVIAVKNIQIANRPQDNDAGIPSKSVKWCLELAYDQNYVPRLNTSDSVFTYFKGQLPFIAKSAEVAERLAALEASERPQRIHYPDLDIPVPPGEYKDLQAYFSIQEDFPLAYGVGSAGLPGLSSMPEDVRKLRSRLIRQHKGFLLFFDQFLANYLAQLGHVKDLFSMNAAKNQFGEYLINHTYFSQSLINVVPNAAAPLPLYIDEGGHPTALEQMMESEAVFAKRKNKFLDHLLGRFAESFSNYTLLANKISGKKAPLELIEDKLNFLANYPRLSAARGKGMNYKDPCKIWHVDNVSGLEIRASLLSGIAEKSADLLVFSPNLKFSESSGLYSFIIYEIDTTNALLQSVVDYDSEIAVKEALGIPDYQWCLSGELIMSGMILE